jgi:isopenicillin-N N-acyltransferase like protein
MAQIVDLTVGDFLLAAGNPCEAPFVLLPWNVLDGPSAPVGDCEPNVCRYA